MNFVENASLNKKRNSESSSSGGSESVEFQRRIVSDEKMLSLESNCNHLGGVSIILKDVKEISLTNQVCLNSLEQVNNCSNSDELVKEDITPNDGRGFSAIFNCLSVTVNPEEIAIISLVNLGFDTIDYDFSSFVNVTSINLSQNNLSSLPNSLCSLESCTKLSLSCNKFSKAPDVLFKGLMFLRDLDISFNLIKEFHEMPFCLSYLVNLNLSHNLLTSPPIWLIYNLPSSLKSLDMSFNPSFKNKLHPLFFEAFEVGVIASKLLSLDISNTCLFTTNEHFLSLFTCLKTLRMSSNSSDTSSINTFYDLPLASLKQMPLEELTVENSYVSSLPQNIDKLSHLRVFHISGNQLQWLPQRFVYLECLSILHASKCKLIYLPKDMGRMTALTELWLSLNDISSLPDLSMCKQLKVVDLYENSFTEFPDELRCHNLEALDISANYFCPKSYTQCQNGLMYDCLKINLRQRIDNLFRLDIVKSDCSSVHESLSNHSRSSNDLWSYRSNSISCSDEDSQSACSGQSHASKKARGLSDSDRNIRSSLRLRCLDSDSVEEESWDIDPNDSWDPNAYSQSKVWCIDDNLSLDRCRTSHSNMENYFCPFRTRSNFYRSLCSHHFGEEVSGQFEDA